MQSDAVIAISPIGDVGVDHILPARGEIERIFEFRTEIIPLIDDLSFAYHEDRDQYHSTAILEKLTALSPPHVVKVLGIAQVDLFIPILTHVFGEAQLGGTACVVSTFRLNESRSGLTIAPRYMERIVKEAIHELGHTFNLRHCPEHTCIMHYCRNEEDVDRKSGQLCRYCIIMLEDEIKSLKIT